MTTLKETYNGWTNYETWCFNLHNEIDETTGTFVENHTEIQGDKVVITEDEYDSVVYDLAQSLKLETEDGNPLGDNSFYNDLLTSAISEINWREIATTAVDQYLVDNEIEKI